MIDSVSLNFSWFHSTDISAIVFKGLILCLLGKIGLINRCF
jgi:hypothetical protein